MIWESPKSHVFGDLVLLGCFLQRRVDDGGRRARSWL